MKKNKKKHPHKNKYVIDLGAASPPALPEKELSEIRGFDQGKIVVWVVTIFVCIFLVFRSEIDGALDRLMGLEPEQPAFSVTVWVNEEKLDNTPLNHENHNHSDELPVHVVPNGAEMRILAEGDVEIKKIEYLFPSLSIETYTIEGSEGSFILPELPANLITPMWIQIYDDTGYVETVEYTLGRLEREDGEKPWQ